MCFDFLYDSGVGANVFFGQLVHRMLNQHCGIQTGNLQLLICCCPNEQRASFRPQTDIAQFPGQLSTDWLTSVSNNCAWSSITATVGIACPRSDHHQSTNLFINLRRFTTISAQLPFPHPFGRSANVKPSRIPNSVWTLIVVFWQTRRLLFGLKYLRIIVGFNCRKDYSKCFQFYARTVKGFQSCSI